MDLAAARPAQLLGSRLILARVGPPDRHVGARFGERQSDPEADPAVAAGDEGGLPGEVEWSWHVVFPFQPPRFSLGIPRARSATMFRMISEAPPATVKVRA